jgi:hypothetical protein
MNPSEPISVTSFEHPPVEIYVYGDNTNTTTIIVDSDDVAGRGHHISERNNNNDDDEEDAISQRLVGVGDTLQLVCANTTLSISKGGDQSTDEGTNDDELVVTPIISTTCMKNVKHFTFDIVSTMPSIEFQQQEEESRDVLEEQDDDDDQHQLRQRLEMRVSEHIIQSNNNIDTDIDKSPTDEQEVLENDISECTQADIQSKTTDLISEVEEDDDQQGDNVSSKMEEGEEVEVEAKVPLVPSDDDNDCHDEDTLPNSAPRFVQDISDDSFSDNDVKVPPIFSIDDADTTDNADGMIDNADDGDDSLVQEEETTVITNNIEIQNDIDQSTNVKQIDATSPNSNSSNNSRKHNHRVPLLQNRTSRFAIRRVGGIMCNTWKSPRNNYNNILVRSSSTNEDGADVIEVYSFASGQVDIEQQKQTKTEVEENNQSTTSEKSPDAVTKESNLVEESQHQNTATTSVNAIVVESNLEHIQLLDSPITSSVIAHVDSNIVREVRKCNHLNTTDHVMERNEEDKEDTSKPSNTTVTNNEISSINQSIWNRPTTQPQDSGVLLQDDSEQFPSSENTSDLYQVRSPTRFSFYRSNTIFNNDDAAVIENCNNSISHSTHSIGNNSDCKGREATITKKFAGAIVGLEQLLNSVSCTSAIVDRPCTTTNHTLEHLIRETGLITKVSSYDESQKDTTTFIPKEMTIQTTITVDTTTADDYDNTINNNLSPSSPARKLNTKTHCGTEGIDVELKTTCDELMSRSEENMDMNSNHGMDPYGEMPVETCQENSQYDEENHATSNILPYDTNASIDYEGRDNACHEDTEFASLYDQTKQLEDSKVSILHNGDAVAVDDKTRYCTQHEFAINESLEESIHNKESKYFESTKTVCHSMNVVLPAGSNISSGRSDGDSHDKYEVALVGKQSEDVSTSQENDDENERFPDDCVQNDVTPCDSDQNKTASDGSDQNNTASDGSEQNDITSDGSEQNDITSDGSDQDDITSDDSEQNDRSSDDSEQIDTTPRDSDKYINDFDSLAAALMAEVELNIHGLSKSASQCCKVENNDDDKSVESYGSSDYGSVQLLERALIAELDEQIQSLSDRHHSNDYISYNNIKNPEIHIELDDHSSAENIVPIGIDTNQLMSDSPTPLETSIYKNNEGMSIESSQSETSIDTMNEPMSDAPGDKCNIPMIGDIDIVDINSFDSPNSKLKHPEPQHQQPQPPHPSLMDVDCRDDNDEYYEEDATNMDETTIKVGGKKKQTNTSTTTKTVTSVFKSLSQRAQFGICPTIDTNYLYVDDVPFDEVPMEPQSLLLSCAHKDAFVNEPIISSQPLPSELHVLEQTLSTAAATTAAVRAEFLLPEPKGDNNVLRSMCSSWSTRHPSRTYNRSGHSLNVQCFSSNNTMFFAPRILSRTTKSPRFICNGTPNRFIGSPRHSHYNTNHIIGTADARVLRSTDDDTNSDYEEQYILDLSLDDTNVPSDEAENVLIFSPVSSFTHAEDEKLFLRSPFCHILTFWD